MKLWDPTTGASIATLTAADRGVLSVAFSPDGRWLAVTEPVGPGGGRTEIDPKVREPFKVPNVNLPRRGFTGF